MFATPRLLVPIVALALPSILPAQASPAHDASRIRPEDRVQTRTQAQAPARAEVIAYLFPRSQPVNLATVPATKLTRINYSFANVVNGRVALVDPVDAPNLAALAGLRQKNPDLQILVSVGGWEWSGGFSDAALTTQSRAVFIESAVALMRQHQLDGLDIDWEYPGVAGSTNHFRPVDGANFAQLLRDLRARFDREQPTGKHWAISIAAGSSAEYIAHSPLADYAPSLDTINLMTYDMYEPSGDKITGNHAPLHTDPADPKAISAATSVRAFLAAGVPAAKLVLGVPFYGHVWKDVPPKNYGLFQPGKPVPNDFAPYSTISSTMLGHGFTRHWDSAAQVPFLYNPASRTFVSFEDPESLAQKCAFIHQQHLAGAMFWELGNDPSGTLLNTLAADLHVSPARSSPSSAR